MRIFHKLLLGFLSLTLLIWVVGFAAIETFQKTREETIASYTLSIAGMILNQIDEEIYTNFIKLSARSKGDTLQRTIQASNNVFRGMADREKYIDQVDKEWLSVPAGEATPFMEQILDLPLSLSFQQEQDFYKKTLGYPLFSELMVTNRYGALAGASNKTTDYRQNDEAWWKETWEKGSFFGPVEYDESSKKFSISLATRVENNRHEPIGVFKGSLDVEDVDDHLKRSEKTLLFRSARLFLLDSTQHYIFPKEKFGKEVEPFIKKYFLLSQTGDGKHFGVLISEAGQRKFFSSKRSSGFGEYPGNGWVLLVSYDSDELFAPIHKMEKFLFSVGGGVTVLSILLGVFFAISFSRPLEKLRLATECFGKSDFGEKIGIASKDEFGSVARAFEMMAENIKSKTISIENLDREIEERRLLEKVSLENALFLQKLMDSIPSPVFYKDISGIYIGCNRAFEAFFGISKSQLVGKKASDLFPPSVARAYQEKDAELLAVPGIQIYETSVKNANGELRNIVFHKATFAGSSGEVEGIIGILVDITLRKLAETAIREGEAFLRTVLDAIASPFAVINADDHVVEMANKAYGGSKCVGRKCHMISHDAESPCVGDDHPCPIHEIKRTGKPVTVEHKHFNQQGQLRCLEIYAYPVFDAKGNVAKIIEYSLDITERKQAEDALKESERRFMDVLYAAQDAILLIDGENFVDCNEATARMLGYRTRKEFLMKHPSELSPPFQPDGRSSFEKANEMMKMAFDRGFHRFEWIHRKASGEDFPVEVSLTPVVVHGRNILHCLWRDMTELKKIEGQVRQLSLAVEQSPSCVVITDKEGKIEYVNQKFIELTGYSKSEVLGQNPRILKSGEQTPEFYKDLWGTILHGKDWQGQICNKKKNGDLYWEFAHIAPIRDEKGEITHFVAVKEDITYRRQVEEQLRHSLRMEAVGRLAGGIAHDFNNMLTVINGYSGYLLGKMKPEDAYYDKVREIRDAGDCAASVVRQLLNLSRREAPKPQMIRVSEVVTKMERMINRLIKDDVELKMEHAQDIGFVKLDAGQMEQVLLNLLVNARDSMPEGGVLTLTTDVVSMEEIQEELKPPIQKKGRFVRISVKDTGTGIDPALRSRILEPFFTTKKRGMNTGLGLSIVYGIIEEAGGAISVESQIGKGTTFRVYLPQVNEVREGGEKERQALEKLPPGRGKILLVEDENAVREFAFQVLLERGYDVRQAGGGQEALAMILEDTGEKYDLLLTDLTMPKMSGKELAVRARGVCPELKVIFMSGYSEQMIADMKDSSFLQKPFSYGQLSVKVWSVLGR